MSDAHTLTKENLLFTFPAGLRENPSIAALGDVTMEALAKRPEEISRLSIYPRIEEMPEDLLDILAHDFKIDWWDPNYSLEEKRRVFKVSWYVHKCMGTKAAVEAALGAVFPGASVLEWFQYGGTPYCFRVDLPLPKEGITAERQQRAVSRIWYYKNLRSHLESINVQAESAGPLRIGACMTASTVIEVWPELISSVEIIGESKMGAVSTMREAVDIYPELVTKLEVTGRASVGAVAMAQQIIEAFPELATQVEITGGARAGALTAARETVGVYPELARKVEITGVAGAGSLTAFKQTVEIFPRLTTQIDAETQAGASGITATHQTVEIYPE